MSQVVSIWKDLIKEYNKLRTKPREEFTKLTVDCSKFCNSIKCNEFEKTNHVNTMVEEWLLKNESYQITQPHSKILNNDENLNYKEGDFLRTVRIENLKKDHSKSKISKKGCDINRSAKRQSPVNSSDSSRENRIKSKNRTGAQGKPHYLNLLSKKTAPPELNVSYINPIPWNK